MSSGTSMAAPHVAGIAALILQASNNSLDYNQVSDIIKTTAIKDDFTGQTVNNTFGHGKINAYEAAKMAYSHASLKNTKHTDFLLYSNTTEIKINAKNGRIENFDVEILDLSGKTIQKYTALNGSNQFIKPLIEGIYIFKITGRLNQVHYTKYLVEEK
jgi:subtilisin family serine protease